MDALWLLALCLACGIGLLLAVFQLPGNWIILLAAIAYAWFGAWSNLPRWVLYTLAALAVLAELWEFYSSAWLSRRAGASPRTSWCALAGGFVGMLVFSLPVPVVGTLAGAVIGCFTGAVIAEWTQRDDWRSAARVGLFAAVGRVLGSVGKLAVTLVMAVLTVGAATWSAIPDRWIPAFLQS